MADFESALQHNMVALLTHDNTNPMFHQIMDFLSRSSINYALTVAPRVATSWVERFWNSIKLQKVNILTTIVFRVAGRKIFIFESQIRNDLTFNDDNGLYDLSNQEIIDHIRQIGYEGRWRFLPSIKVCFLRNGNFFFIHFIIV